MTCPQCNGDSATNSFNESFCKGCGKLVGACNCDKVPEKVSIIIPCYNAEKYIQNSIRNALRQTYENIEVIVVDDGSTDRTMLNLIRDPLANQIKIIEKENGGVGSAINAGIKNMTGNWFKWLSADDTLEKYAISTMMHYINKTINNQDKIFYTHYKIIDKNNKFIGRFIEPDRNDFDYVSKCAVLFNNYYGNATTSMMHKSVFERAGFFDDTLQNGEDYDFWLRCLFKHNIELHLVPEVLACYRKHDNQLTKRRGVELYKTVEKIRKKNIDYLDPDVQKKVMIMSKQLNNLGTGVKIRRHMRDLLFSLLPNKVNNKILSQYRRTRNRI